MPVDNELYNRLSSTWWNEGEPLNLLRTSLNPGRFGYYRDVILTQVTTDPRGIRVLDLGCGGGLLAEEFAGLGCRVIGVDPSAPSLETARTHAQRAGLEIDYKVGVGEDLPFEDESFQIVCCSDVFEHVNDLEKVIAEIARIIEHGGILLFDTINRTVRSKIVVIKLAQEWKLTGFMPSNLHDWNGFIRPRELVMLMQRHGLACGEVTGLTPRTHPILTAMLLLRYRRGNISLHEMGLRMRFQRTDDTSILYMGYAVKT